MICDEASIETSTEQVIHVIQENWDQPRKHRYMLHHGSPGPLQQSAHGLSLPLTPWGHSPHFSHRDSVITWALSHWSHNQSLSDALSLSESNSDSYKVLQGWSGPAPMASLPHPLPLPSPPPTQLQPPWSWLLLKHTRQVSLQPLLHTSLSQRVSMTLYRKSTASCIPITLFLQNA